MKARGFDPDYVGADELAVLVAQDFAVEAHAVADLENRPAPVASAPGGAS
jgi:hypothetical protein